jgi:hypothetical protein
MTHIRRIDERAAEGQLKEDFEYISGSYSHAVGTRVPTPQVYTTSSIVPAYFRFGAVQNRVLTNNGAHDKPAGQVPNILVNFALSFYSSCFY